MNLIGFSIGALIAQHFTSEYFHKINKLIIIASVYKRTEEQINKVKNLFSLLRPSGTTPEGLCFEAVMNEIIPSSNNSEVSSCVALP